MLYQFILFMVVIPALCRSLAGSAYMLHVMLAAGTAWIAGINGDTGFSTFRVMLLCLIYLVSINAVTFGLYGWDKRAAATGSRRVPEHTLHSFALAGGTIAALVAMRFFRHKTAQTAFNQTLKVIMALQLLAMIALSIFIAVAKI